VTVGVPIVSARVAPVAVAFALMVTDDAELTVRIVVPTGMPVAVTCLPTSCCVNAAVALVRVALLEVVAASLTWRVTLNAAASRLTCSFANSPAWQDRENESTVAPVQLRVSIVPSVLTIRSCQTIESTLLFVCVASNSCW
jgi:hypothetical protein